MKSRIVPLSIVTLALIWTFSSAQAEPGGSEPEEFTHPQDPNTLVDTAETLSNLWKESGFGSVTINDQDKTILVKWKGELPDAVEKLQETSEVRVMVEQVPISQSEVDAAADSIFAAAQKLHGDHGTVAVLPNEDMSELLIEVTPGSSTMSDNEGAQVAFEQATDLPFRVIPGEVNRMPMSRQNDSAPWQGGGAMETWNRCSTGFAVKTASGRGLLVSASHCGYAVGATVKDGAGDVIGTVAYRKGPDIDTILIDPVSSPATVGKVFGGPWNAATTHSNYQFWVAGMAAPSTAENVCTSGATSGMHCGLDVYATGVNFPCGAQLEHQCQGFRAKTSGVAIATGDSGGPIFYRRTDGRVGARGIMSNGIGTEPTSCGSMAISTECRSSIEGIGIHRILDNWDGLAIEV